MVAGLGHSVGFVGATSYDAASRRVASMDGNGNVTQYGYDDADRLLIVADALNQTVQNQYND
jgi:YD repeat-containing protein